MKRSNVIILTLAGVSLAATRCHRTPAAGPVNVHSTAVLPPGSLSPAMRATLPAFAAGYDTSYQSPPHNAYDPQLGYYHQPCSGWFPYPYDHYDSRWGYYRCGRWSRYHSTQAYSSSSSYYRSGPIFSGTSAPLNSSQPTSTARPGTAPPALQDYALQPSGAPVHNGVPQSQATATRAAFAPSSSSHGSSYTSRGGFGHTGYSSGHFSGS
ncbi:hypothetical protein [Prosthecobacter sp.]|uniref:hypothetical protein n=1 Tax=Prosthecobacter sp. TaxID=1965333 RepID=UPI003782DFAD